MLTFIRSKILSNVSSVPVQRVKIPPEPNIFHSIKFFILYAQLLGVFPQENILKDVKTMHFKWLSWHTLYSSFYFMVLASAFLCSLAYRMQKGNGGIDSISASVFLGGGLAIIIVMIQLATVWSELMQSWCRVDKVMNASYGYPDSLDFKIRFASFVYLLLGLCDFILSISNQLAGNYSLEGYYRHSATALFFYIPYHPFIGIIYTIAIAQATLCWALIDMIIIVLSIALALRFKQITMKLEDEKLNNLTDSQSTILLRDNSVTYWKTIREDYDRLACLCKELDSKISSIVLLSYFLNLFFLLVQLYHSISYMSLLINKVYFVFSFLYLIFKTVSVSLYAAWINDESKAPTNILNSVDSTVYNVEIRRLLTQISFDKTALTGCKMFNVTRGLILSVASAVVTYELVLIQFNNANLYDTSN